MRKNTCVEEEGCERLSFGSTPNDPRSIYYRDKIKYGSSFYAQEIVSYPLSSVGCVLLQSKAKMMLVWEKSHRSLPVTLTRALRRGATGF